MMILQLLLILFVQRLSFTILLESCHEEVPLPSFGIGITPRRVLLLGRSIKLFELILILSGRILLMWNQPALSDTETRRRSPDRSTSNRCRSS